MFYNEAMIFYSKWLTRYGGSSNIFKRIRFEIIRIVWKVRILIILRKVIYFKKTRLELPELIFEFGAMLETFGRTMGADALHNILSHLITVWVNTDEDTNPENPKCITVTCNITLNDESEAEICGKLINEQIYTTFTFIKNGRSHLTNYGALDTRTKTMQQIAEAEFRESIYITTKNLLFSLIDEVK